MLILISDAFDAELPGKLSKFGEVTDDKARVAEADVVLVRAKTKCNKEWIDGAKNCRLIIRGGVGIDNIDKAYAESKGIIVKNTPKASSIAVAELTFALLLSIPNHIVYYHNGMKNGEWLKNTKRTELYGKTLGFIGMGNIARKVAERAIAFGMTVVAYDKYLDQVTVDKMVKGVKMVKTPEEAVKDADYVTLHTPLTDETRGMVNASLISKMTKKPALVNTCRADVINADDVNAALLSGDLAWYASDVYPSDPPTSDYVLLKNEKVTLTPHVGANSVENLNRIGDEVVETIDALIKDGSLKTGSCGCSGCKKN